MTSQSVRLVGGGWRGGGQRRSTFSVTTPGQWDEADTRVTSQSVRLVGGGGGEEVRDDQHSASLRQVSGGRGRHPCDITERQARRRGGGQRRSTFSVTTPGQWDEADTRVTSQSVRLVGGGGGGGVRDDQHSASLRQVSGGRGRRPCDITEGQARGGVGWGVRDDQHSASLRQVSGGRGRRPCDITERQARRGGWRGGGQRRSTFSVTTPGQWDEADTRVTSQRVRLVGGGGGGEIRDYQHSASLRQVSGERGRRPCDITERQAHRLGG